MTFERIGGDEVWSGRIATVCVDRYRHDDGEAVEREVVRHPGAVAVVAHDGEDVYLVRQPREPVNEQALLELPAGKLDEQGEEPLDTARRELSEEIGKGARSWRHLKTFYSSPGFSDEQVLVYLATDLYDDSAESDENERIEVEPVPLADLGSAIERCKDAKSLVGLLMLEHEAAQAA